MNESKKINITFAPGCFDNFEGTQEELDQMISDIQKALEDGSLFEKSQPLDIDQLLESNDPQDQMLAERLIRSFNEDPSDRILQ